MKQFCVFCEGYLCDQVGVLIDVGNEDYLENICEQVENVAKPECILHMWGAKNLKFPKCSYVEHYRNDQ